MDATTESFSQPYWIPEGFNFDALPQAFQQAITEILNPAYQELVLAVGHPLERSAGATYVHLLWLELLQQFELGDQMDTRLWLTYRFPERADMIAQHLRLVGAKQH